MTLEFTAKELNRIQILDQEIDPETFDHKGLPSDTHIVMYQIEGKLLYDETRSISLTPPSPSL